MRLSLLAAVLAAVLPLAVIGCTSGPSAAPDNGTHSSTAAAPPREAADRHTAQGSARAEVVLRGRVRAGGRGHRRLARCVRHPDHANAATTGLHAAGRDRLVHRHRA